MGKKAGTNPVPRISATMPWIKANGGDFFARGSRGID
jgi:hypothetical protein